MNPSDRKLSYRPELDGLRALAIIGVLLFHLGVTSFGGGFLGVDVFFVLSGFLITRLILKDVQTNTFSYIDFYVRRARRLFPALLFTAAMTLLAGAFLFSPAYFAATAEAGIFSVLSLANIHSWLSAGYFDLTSAVKPFLHYWSLSVEEQFYLIWPFLMVICFKRFKRKMGLAILAIISVVSFLALVSLQESHYDAVFFLMPFRIWEFGMGALIAGISLGTFASSDGERRAAAATLSSFMTLAGIAMILSSFIFGQNIEHFGAQLFLAAIGAALIITAPVNFISTLLLANPLCVWLGKISYSLYLWHWPIIVYLRYYIGSDWSFMWMGFATILSIGLAALTHRIIENRFRRPWTSDIGKDRLAVPAALAPLALIIVFISSLIWNQSGWKWRLSPEMRNIVDVVAERPSPNCDWRNIEGTSKRLCVFGDRRDVIDIAVIGDSHSNGLASGMTFSMKSKRLTGVANSEGGKIPLMNTNLWVEGVGDRGDLNQSFKDILVTEPDYIVLHARYALYWHTEGTGNELRDLTRHLLPMDGTEKMSVETTQQQFKKSLRETLAHIKSQGVTPVVVGPIPNPGVNPVQCLSRPLIRTLENSSAICKGFSQTQSKGRNADVMSVLKNISQEEDAIFYDPTNIFCPKSDAICRRVWNDKLVYRDDNHLSLYGARILGGKVIALIEEDKAKRSKARE